MCHSRQPGEGEAGQGGGPGAEHLYEGACPPDWSGQRETGCWSVLLRGPWQQRRRAASVTGDTPAGSRPPPGTTTECACPPEQRWDSSTTTHPSARMPTCPQRARPTKQNCKWTHPACTGSCASAHDCSPSRGPPLSDSMLVHNSWTVGSRHQCTCGSRGWGPHSSRESQDHITQGWSHSRGRWEPEQKC